jgi:mRNA-degrading endonuclease RelE of RelBE toxin-antitoxin system
MTWNVFLTQKAYKQVVKLPSSIQDLVDMAVADLEEHGTHPRGWDIQKTGNDEYRLWLTYRYRMRYRVTDGKTLEIEIFYVGHRRDAYR